MDFFYIKRSEFDEFFIENLKDILDSKKFLIKYRLFNSDYALRYYKKHNVEGICFSVSSDDNVMEYNSLISTCDIKIRGIRQLRDIIEKQKKYKIT